VGLYYNPQPPHIGAAQPLEPRKLTPPSGVGHSNPPFTGSKVGQEVLASWAAVAAFVVLPALFVPPPAGAAQPPPSASLTSVLDTWDVKPPAAIVARNLTPASGPTPSNPPVIGARVPAAVQVAWAPPPWPAQWSPPVIQGAAVAIPPPPIGARVPTAVMVAWLPPPWPSQSSPPLIQGLIPPPPVGSVVPKAVMVSWIPPAPQPIVGQSLTPPSVIVSNPPIVGTAIPLATLNWWYQPFTPIIVGSALTPPVSGPTPPPPVIVAQGGGGKKKKRGPSVRPIWDYANDGRLIRQTVSTDHSKPVEARRAVDTTLSELAREIELERTKLDIAGLKSAAAAPAKTEAPKAAPVEPAGDNDDEQALALLDAQAAKESEAVRALLQEISDLGMSDDERSEIVAKIEGGLAEMHGSFSKFSESIEGMFRSILDVIVRTK
jgi:hypothetical protein